MKTELHSLTKNLSRFPATLTLLTLLAAATARAGTNVVTSTADSGAGTLRTVVSNSVSGDTINFTNTLSGHTILLTSGQILLNKNLRIDGSALSSGITISGGNASRIFQASGGTTNILLNLTLTGGNGLGAIENGNGGAIYSEGSLTLTACTVSGNSGAGGGGIFSQNSTSRFIMTNCTVAGNTALFGGAFLIRNSSTVSLVHCTVSTNTGTGGTGGAVLESGGTLALQNTIVAGNGDEIGGCGGTLTRSGNNIIGAQPSCYTAIAPVGAPNVNGDYVGTSGSPVNALLAPLGDYGGSTKTIPPLPGSPAINAAGASASNTDQRGYPRPVGFAADIGSVEVQTTLVVSNTADSGPGSLRQAVISAAGNPGPDIIGFIAALNGGTIQLNSEIGINDTNGVAIDATSLSSGLTIQGKADQGTSGNFRLFSNTNGSTVTFSGLTLAKGGGNGFTNSINYGGAIINYGTLALIRCSLSNNIAYDGGAIYNSRTQALAQCTLSGNLAFDQGGALYNYKATATLTRCTLAGNSAGDVGGAINNNQGMETLTQCTLFGNSANDAGAISDYGSRDTLTHCTLAGNSATSGGGAIYNVGAIVTLANSIVAGNRAGNHKQSSDIAMENGSITNVGANIVPLLLNVNGSGTVNGPAAIQGNPLLAPLGNYGGLTQTMPPLPGSPAIDGAAPISLTTDQRGFAMPQDSTGSGTAKPDIGAVEGVYNPAGPGVLTGLVSSPNWASVGQQRFEFTQFTSGSTAYTVFASTNLALPFNAWSNLGTNVVESPPRSGEFLFTDPLNATNLPRRFYRVRSP